MSPAHARRSRNTRGRSLVLVLVVLLLVGGFFLDRGLGGSNSGVAAALSPTSVAADTATSSALSCGGIGIRGDFVASANIEITNNAPTARTVSALVTNGVSGSVTAAPFSVSPRSSWTFNPSHILNKGSWLSVRLLANGGGLSAVIVPTSGRSATITPCISQTSQHWYFAGGSTNHGDQIDYAIFNPTETPAVVNVTMVTNSGVLSPQNAQGLLVPAGAEYIVSGASEAPNLNDLATTITAEQGAVVAFATQLHPSGLSSSIMAGQSSLYGEAVLAHATQDPVSKETLIVANPTSLASTVTVSAHTPYGRTAPWIETMPAYSIWNLDLTGSSRIPLTSPFALTVTSTGGGVSTALRVLALHASHAGLSLIPLNPMTNTGSTLMPAWPGSALSSLSLFNPGSKAVAVTIGTQRSSPGQAVTVPAGTVVALPVGTLSQLAITPFTITGSVITGGNYAGGVLSALGAFAALAKN